MDIGAPPANPTAAVTGWLVGSSRGKMANSPRSIATQDSCIGSRLIPFAEEWAAYRIRVQNFWRGIAQNTSFWAYNQRAMTCEAVIEDRGTGKRARLTFSSTNIGSVPGGANGGAGNYIKSDAVTPGQFARAVGPKGGGFALWIRRSFDRTANASFQGTIAASTLTASGVTGLITSGQLLQGTGVSGGCTIIKQLTGTTGLDGTYLVRILPGDSTPAAVSTAVTMTCCDQMPWGSANGAWSFDGEFEYQYDSATVSAATIAATYLDGLTPLADGAATLVKTAANAIVASVFAPVFPTGGTAISCMGGIFDDIQAVRPFVAEMGYGNSIHDGSAGMTAPAPNRYGIGLNSEGSFDHTTKMPLGAFAKATVSGDRLAFLIADGYAPMTEMAKFANTFGFGPDAFHNDAANSRTPAQMVGDCVTLATAFKAVSPGSFAYSSTTTPYTTSTDSFATVANQTPVSGFATGGTQRDGLKTALLAAAGAGNPIDVIWTGMDAIAGDSTFPDRWTVTYGAQPTPEGIHPNQIVVLPVGAALATWRAATLTPRLGGSAT